VHCICILFYFLLWMKGDTSSSGDEEEGEGEEEILTWE
jgi:hypothetical protein